MRKNNKFPNVQGPNLYSYLKYSCQLHKKLNDLNSNSDPFKNQLRTVKLNYDPMIPRLINLVEHI